MKKTKKTDIIIFILILIFSCIIFSKYLISHYSTDSFMIIDKTYKGYAMENSFIDGRIFMGCIDLIAKYFNFTILAFNRILLFLAIIISCIVIIMLKNIILKYKKANTKLMVGAITFICYYTIFNFMYIENLYFAEGFVMACSLLFYILAANCIVDGKKYSIIKTLILLILGIFSYQATISMFYICILLFSMLKNEDWKQIIKRFFIGIVLRNYCSWNKYSCYKSHRENSEF